MANAEISQYHKYIDLQNVSGSGDPSSAPAGGIYLFASGTAGNAKLYLQNEGVSSPLSLADGGTLQIADGNGGTDTVNMAADTFTLTGSSGLTSAVTDNQAAFSVNVDDSGIEIAADKLQLKDLGVGTAKIAADAVTNAKLANISRGSVKVGGASDAPTDLDAKGDGKILVGDGTDVNSVAVSGDITLANDGTVAIASGVIVNADIDSAAAIDMDKLDGGSLASSLSDLAQGDLLYAGDIDDSNNLKSITFSNFEDAIFGNMNAASSDVAVAAGGAITLANNSVGVAEVATAVAGDGLTGGGGSALSVQVSGAVVVANDKVGLSGSVAGDGLGFAGGADSISALSVKVDDSTIQINSDSLRVKVDGIDSQHIALGALDSEHYSTGSIESNHLKGSVANAKLANSAVTLGSTSVSLGATTDTIAGLTQLTSSFLQVETGLFPDAAGGATLGSTSLGFGDVFIADDKALHFGNNQDVKMEYNEDGDDEFEITVPSDGMRLHGPTDVALILGDGEAGDKRIVFDGQAVDFHAGLDHDNQKFSLGLGSVPGTTPNMLLASANRDVEFLGNISVPQTKIISLDTDGDSSLRASADDTIQLRVGGSDMVTVVSTGVASTSGLGVNGGYTTGNGVSLGADGSGNFDGNLNVGSSGGSAGASFTAHGDGANQKMFFNHSTNKLGFFKDDGSGSQETILNIAGTSANDYAIDVAQGSSNNINKIRAAAFVTYSDESLKEDVSSMASTALDTVMSLEGVEFTWKDSGERDFGFIAQDVQSVLPKAVHTATDGVQGVDYSRLTSVLVEAVKAQQIQIEELKAILKK